MRALCLLLIAAPAFCATSFSTTPLPVAAGEELTLCAANVGRHKAEMTLKFVNVRTGAILAQKDVVLDGVGGKPFASDPCLTTKADTSSTVVGFVSVKASFFDTWKNVTASIQLKNPGESQVARTIPLEPTNVPPRERREPIVAAGTN
jgi:hypothetical protein